jgi:uncharacterized iron-regulated protein
MKSAPGNGVAASGKFLRYLTPRIGRLRLPSATFLGLVIAGAIASSSWSGSAADNGWASAHYRDHPLAGAIWSSELNKLAPAELENALSGARFVLLGEIHDNPDHHRLQAQLIDALVRRGRRPAVVFEMIPASLQGELDRFAKSGERDAAKLGKALKWEERGWPEWRIYQPIAEIALSAGLPLIAGGLDPDVQKAAGKGAPPELYDRIAQEFDLAKPLKPEIAAAEGREIKEGHCNLLPDAALPPMLRVQRAVDGALAKAMASANPGEGAVLIAGGGHVRNDWAVANILREKAPDAKVVSLAFVEVDPERAAPSDYMKAAPGLEKPFDFIYLTPRADLTDHCAELEKQLKAKKSKPAG